MQVPLPLCTKVDEKEKELRDLRNKQQQIKGVPASVSPRISGTSEQLAARAAEDSKGISTTVSIIN
jgi:hypothetical protein